MFAVHGKSIEVTVDCEPLMRELMSDYRWFQHGIEPVATSRRGILVVVQGQIPESPQGTSYLEIETDRWGWLSGGGAILNPHS